MSSSELCTVYASDVRQKNFGTGASLMINILNSGSVKIKNYESRKTARRKARLFTPSREPRICWYEPKFGQARRKREWNGWNPILSSYIFKAMSGIVRDIVIWICFWGLAKHTVTSSARSANVTANQKCAIVIEVSFSKSNNESD
jgi:hypothetical protein